VGVAENSVLTTRPQAVIATTGWKAEELRVRFPIGSRNYVGYRASTVVGVAENSVSSSVLLYDSTLQVKWRPLFGARYYSGMQIMYSEGEGGKWVGGRWIPISERLHNGSSFNINTKSILGKWYFNSLSVLYAKTHTIFVVGRENDRYEAKRWPRRQICQSHARFISRHNGKHISGTYR
jgi:hypothetical protein